MKFTFYSSLLVLAMVMFSCQSAPDESQAGKSETQEELEATGNPDIQEVAPSASVDGYAQTYPIFPGCTEEDYEARKKCGQQKMMKALHSVMNYPQKALDDQVKGTVLHQFVIQADGSMTDLKLTKSLTPETDEAARKAIVDMMVKYGNWEPATLKGKAVSARYTLPLRFSPPK